MPIVRTLLLTAIALFGAHAMAKTPATKAAPAAAPLSVTLNQGEVARWPGIAAKSCVLGGKKYPAVDSVCYYPFDVEAAVGRHAIALIDQDGKRHSATAIVEKVDRPKVDINLTDDAYINVSQENQKRQTRRARGGTEVVFCANRMNRVSRCRSARRHRRCRRTRTISAACARSTARSKASTPGATIRSTKARRCGRSPTGASYSPMNTSSPATASTSTMATAWSAPVST